MGGSLVHHGMNSKTLTDRKVAQQVKGQGPLWTPLFNGYSDGGIVEGESALICHYETFSMFSAVCVYSQLSCSAHGVLDQCVECVLEL